MARLNAAYEALRGACSSEAPGRIVVIRANGVGNGFLRSASAHVLFSFSPSRGCVSRPGKAAGNTLSAGRD